MLIIAIIISCEFVAICYYVRVIVLSLGFCVCVCVCVLGPAAYSLPSESVPAPKIGERLDREQGPLTPAPNRYGLPSTIPPAREAGKSFGVRRELKSAQLAPPPNVYSIERPRTASAHFTYRAFPLKSKTIMR